jgi:hypothetical protein
MAIKPEELIRNLEVEVNSFEIKIDEYLKSRKILSGQSVSVKAPDGFKSVYVPILKERYINAGWKDVIYHSEQKDGDYVVFKS